MPGIRAETRYFVPLGETLEVWRTRITNERPEPARLSLFGSVEFCLWDAHDDATNFQRNYSIGEVEVADGVIYHTTEYRERRDHFAFFACSERAAGFDTSRDAFLGPYRGWDRPLAVERGTTSDSIAHGWQPIGAHQVRLELAPGETREIIFVLGYAENPRDAKFDPPGSGTLDKRRVRPVIERYLDPTAVDEALRTLGAHWDALLGTFAGRDRPRAPRPDGQHLERLPVHGHVQPVALGLVVRVRDRPRDGLPRLDPGPAGLRSHGPGAGARTDPRHRRDPAARPAAPTTSTSR